MGRYIKIKESFNSEGKKLHRNLFVIFCKCCIKSLQREVDQSSPLMPEGRQHEILGDAPYNFGMGVAATAMLSIAHSSVPLRIRK